MPTIETARKWYPEDDPVHGFSHILRVYNLAQRLAQSEGADLEIVGAAALLHDVGDPAEDNARLDHQQAAAVFAGQVLRSEGWPPEKIAAVQHCIRSHRFRNPSEQPHTIEAKVLFDADKLDAIGAVGAVRAIAYAVLAGEDLYMQPSDHFLRTGKKEANEPHTPYHEHLFKLQKIKDRMFTKTGRAMAEARHIFLAQFFDQLQAELQSER